jgi:hypothetical protein
MRTMQLGWCLVVQPRVGPLPPPPKKNTTSNTILLLVSYAVTWRQTGHRFRGNVFTEPLVRNGYLFIRLLHSKGCARCPFRGICRVTCPYATLHLNYMSQFIYHYILYFYIIFRSIHKTINVQKSTVL